ncbi:MAG: hypothetical protein ACE37B_10960 [Ilumatobacter sp.]|uniref:hypothetical protein n=1 Tax=Ilumatobacter sp. TaxID=1967498 RepID=UPI003918FD61
MTVHRETERTVFLLGAGFSKAVGREMPTMVELGAELARQLSGRTGAERLLSDAERVAVRAGRVPMNNLEVWLSSLATKQPFLREADNLRRRSVFLEVSEMISEIIRSRETEVRSRPIPEWLQRIVTAWHAMQTTVLTLNYDLLVESVVRALVLRGGDHKAQPVHIAGGVPPELPEKGQRFADEISPTFTLRKLHGSINWFGRHDSHDLFSVVRIDSLVPGWASSAPASVSRNSAATIEGLSPILLPPVADKGSLYGNPTIGSLWRSAHRELNQARRLVLFGYSLPPTDASMLALLTETLGADTQIDVIDRDPRPVAELLRSLGVARTRLRQIAEPGTDSFADYLDETEQGVAHAVDWAAVSQIHPECYSAVCFPDRTAWPVIGVQEDDTEVALIIGTEPNPSGLVRPSSSSHLPETLRKATLIKRSDGYQARPTAVRVRGNTTSDSTLEIDATPLHLARIAP